MFFQTGAGMSAQWVNSPSGLPQEGQPVQFILDDREVMMKGRLHPAGVPITLVGL
jgi:hypothetical protein